MTFSKSDCILTEEGYEIIKHKYQNRIDELLSDMYMQHQKDKLEEEQWYKEYLESQPNNSGTECILPSNEELPFN